MTLPLHHQLSFTISIIVLAETKIVDFYVHLLFKVNTQMKGVFYWLFLLMYKDESSCEEWLFFVYQRKQFSQILFIPMINFPDYNTE